MNAASFFKLNTELVVFVKDVIIRGNIQVKYNIIKFFTAEFKISLLNYSKFWEMPHPELQSSVTIDLATGKIKKFNYSKSNNSPILHRKELFIDPAHPDVEKFKALTKAEKAEGLYENTRIIGFKKNWEKLLYEKGLSYKGHKLIKKTISKRNQPEAIIKTKPDIKRHKTAISRYNLSKPVQTLIEYGLINEKTSFFDYGCGQGDDVDGLKKMGFVAAGWDPVFKPLEAKQQADIINLGFVINVIEDQIERTEVLHKAYELTIRLLVVSSMISNSNTAHSGTPCNDGILTQNSSGIINRADNKRCCPFLILLK